MMGKIVVGVDGSAGSRDALRWAFAEAKLRGASLEVVIVWQYPITASLPTFGAMNTPDDFEVDARSTLLAILADEGISAEAPIPVSTLVAEGNPARALLDASEGTDLLVVGSRGHGGFTGVLVGSISQQCVHHAKCPVVVVHPS
jgi:nucleotide-binding universal stress UspA family protein